MSPHLSRPNELSDGWRYALGGGLVAVPLMTLGYLETGSELSLGPVLLGGVVAGYLAARKTGTHRGVGARVGLVASLPALLVVSDILLATRGLGGPDWFVAAGLALAVGTAAAVVAVVVFFSVLSGVVGARVGGWLAPSGDPHGGAGA
ncbi:DUF5518 domain-containing protein [Halosimplex salinum]|uniref:DUF5518 domain-containing protein n=1 Tax=Halosimplex salinum TaxID=1710538 RepID=UPI000F491734|nr:DUF5518 domain-containing protein [Halosimplex salinum]